MVVDEKEGGLPLPRVLIRTIKPIKKVNGRGLMRKIIN
jgi:hypothetical protein